MRNSEPVGVISRVANPFSHLSEQNKQIILILERELRSTDRPYGLIPVYNDESANRAIDIAGILVTRGWNVYREDTGFVIDIKTRSDA